MFFRSPPNHAIGVLSAQLSDYSLGNEIIVFAKAPGGINVDNPQARVDDAFCAACILRTPHDGVAAMLSPGTYGHGGAWGTQAWVDPVKGVAYVLMVQRSNFPNSDASDVRRAFQEAAAKSAGK